MAQLVGVIDTSHQWIGRPPGEWDTVRRSRRLRPDVPEESDEERVKKAERLSSAVNQLREKLDELDPDVLVIFGDEQSENYPAPELRVMPRISVYIGDEFFGAKYDTRASGPRGRKADGTRVAIEDPQTVRNHPELAKGILYHLLDNGFDPAFCMNMPNPELGIGHAIMNPIGYFTDYTRPVVPIVLNAIYAPCLTGRRAYELGREVRRAIDSFPTDLRVVAIGSGGLWHTTQAEGSWLNEEFDRIGLKYLSEGDIEAWARHFDTYPVEGDPSQLVEDRGGASSGLPATPGPQHGTRETLDWIAASATADGSRFTVVDFVPVYSSPIDCAFAYCDEVS